MEKKELKIQPKYCSMILLSNRPIAIVETHLILTVYLQTVRALKQKKLFCVYKKQKNQ